jgi:thioredoxin-like negative regulator of GroEL
VAPAWKGTLEDTTVRAAEILPSGEVKWGLDAEEQIFAAYGVPYQPMTFLISADKQVVDTWSGIRSEEELRAALDRLIDVPG